MDKINYRPDLSTNLILKYFNNDFLRGKDLQKLHKIGKCSKPISILTSVKFETPKTPVQFVVTFFKCIIEHLKK